jgi:hypothetical protein
MHGDFEQRRVDWLETPPQLFKIGQSASVDFGVEDIGKFGLAQPRSSASASSPTMQRQVSLQVQSRLVIGDVFAGQGRGSRIVIEEASSPTPFHHDRQA